MSFVLPEKSGAYRWWYVDVTAGDLTAVAIFMVGSVFSARYSASLSRGGLPQQHAAVNFALYQGGVRRHWVLTEYRDVAVSEQGRRLHIGHSTLAWHDDGALHADIVDVTAHWRHPVHAHLALKPQGRGGDALTLVPGLSHRWRPVAPRAAAALELPSLALSVAGDGYHDENFGDVPLGSDLAGWEWARLHAPEQTRIVYRPWANVAPLEVVATDACSVERRARGADDVERTIWGLPVPLSLGLPAEPRLLESSPFYARLEASDGRSHAMGEVADFHCFHQPWVRWMASLRTRHAPMESTGVRS